MREKRACVRKLLSLGIAGLLLTSCKGNTGEDQTTGINETRETSPLQTEASSITQSSGSSEMTQADKKPPTYDIDWTRYDSVVWMYDSFANIDAANTDAINARLIELGSDTIIRFSKGIMGDMYAKQVKASIQSETPPDILTAGIGDAGADQGTDRACRNGWLMQLDEYLASSEGKTLYESVPEKVWLASSYNGHYYGISTMLPFSYRMSFYVDTDMAKQLNVSLDEIKACKSIEDLEPILDRVASQEDCDLLVIQEMNNMPLRILFPEYDFLKEIHNVTSTALIAGEADTARAESLFEQELTRTRLNALARYQTKGYIPKPDQKKSRFLIYVGEDDIGTVGNFVTQVAVLDYPGTKDVENIPFAVGYLPTNYNSICGICDASLKKDKALKILEWILTDKELSDLFIHGPEYDRVYVDGKIMNEEFITRGLYFPNALIAEPHYFDHYETNKTEYVKELYASVKSSVFTGLYMDLSSVKTEVEACEAEIQSRERSFFYGLFDDVDQELAVLNQSLKDAGIDHILLLIDQKP